MNHPIFPCLWFDGMAREAAGFYCSVFAETNVVSENPIVVTIESSGQKFMLLNGGPFFTLNPAISFYVFCETVAEAEQTWEKLAEDGQVLMPLDTWPWSEKYGWVQDKFGVSWQISAEKPEGINQKFIPSLMFTQHLAGKAEQAIQFYTSIFRNSSTLAIARYNAGEPDVEGTIKHARFKLNDQVFMAMDSSLGHTFCFNESVSLVLECDTQIEIDYYWKKLSAVPEAEQCGWLKDQYGISWQIVPKILEQLMNDPLRSKRVMNAFMQMKKFDIALLLGA